MYLVLFSKVVNMDDVSQEFTGNSLASLIGTSKDGTELAITINSQSLFKYAMYHYGGNYFDLEEEDYDLAATSVNNFIILLNYLHIKPGVYNSTIRSEIAEKCLECVPLADSPHDGNIVRVDESIYVNSSRVLEIIEDFPKSKIIIKANPVSDDVWELNETLVD